MYILYPYITRIVLPLFVLMVISFSHQVFASNLNVGGSQNCEYYFSVYEKKFQIPQHLLKAISLQESGMWRASLKKRVAWPWTMNVKGKGYRYDSMAEAVAAANRFKASGIRSFDVGCMQVNMRYHPEAFRNLHQAFNPKYNVAYAAYILRQHYEDSGSWDKAVAYYHSKTASKGNRYVKSVRKIWHKERNTNTMALLESKQERQEFAANNVIAHYPVSRPKPDLPSFELSKN